MFPPQDTGFLDGAFECQNAALVPLSRLLYDELVKSILRIVEKLDLSVQKVTPGEEVRHRAPPSAVQIKSRSLTRSPFCVRQTPDDGAHVLPSSDPTAHLLPNKMKDFTAFVNLVDFCRWRIRNTLRLRLSWLNASQSHPLFFCLLYSELLLKRHVEYFQSWVYPLSHELVLHSIRNPLVSGFYKLLSVAMRVAKKIRYYQVHFLPLEI